MFGRTRQRSAASGAERRAYDTDGFAQLRRCVADGDSLSSAVDAQVAADLAALTGEPQDVCLGSDDARALLGLWDWAHARQGAAGDPPIVEHQAWAGLREAREREETASDEDDQAALAQLFDVLAERAGVDLRGGSLMDALGLDGEGAFSDEGVGAMIQIWDYVRGQAPVVQAAPTAASVPAAQATVAEDSVWAAVRSSVRTGNTLSGSHAQAAFRQLVEAVGERAGLTRAQRRIAASHLGQAMQSAICVDGARILLAVWESVRGQGGPVTPGSAGDATVATAGSGSGVRPEPAAIAGERAGRDGRDEVQTREAQAAVLRLLRERAGLDAHGWNLVSILEPFGGNHSSIGQHRVVALRDWLNQPVITRRAPVGADTAAIREMRAVLVSGEGCESDEQKRLAQQACQDLRDRLATLSGVGGDLHGLFATGRGTLSNHGVMVLLHVWDWLRGLPGVGSDAQPDAPVVDEIGDTPPAAQPDASPAAEIPAELRERIAWMRHMAARELAYGDRDWNCATLRLLLEQRAVREALLDGSGAPLLHAISETVVGSGLIAHEYRALLDLVDAALNPLSSAERAELERLTREAERIAARRAELERRARGGLA